MRNILTRYFLVPWDDTMQPWTLSIAEEPDGDYVMIKENDWTNKQETMNYLTYRDAEYDFLCTHDTWVQCGAEHVGSYEEEFFRVEEEL